MKHDELFIQELFPHAAALKTFAFHLTLNENDADDLVQETYLKAYKFIENYDQGTNSKAWLFKILKNAYINEYRKKSRRPSTTDIDVTYVHKEGEATSQNIVHDMRHDVFEATLGDEVTIALNSLQDEFKTVILLCDINDFTYEEMAKILELPVGTVRSRLFRARNMLKDKLKNYATKMGYKDYRTKRPFDSEEE
ncbi:MAG: sigma-70 family RNA polymerase sigma factor [Saprospiraceae bacterium]